MRLLHTSDWHLGRTLHGVDLLDHQSQVLDHIVEVAEQQAVDAVLVAGDVFDRAIPPVEAVRLLERTLRRLTRRATVIVTSGNHDSAIRLGYGSSLFPAGLHVITGVDSVGTAIELADQHGPVLVYPFPYLDPDGCRRQLADGDEPLARSHEAVCAAAMARVRADLERRQAAGGPAARTVVMAHAFVGAGAAEPAVTSLSERDIRVGGVDYVPSGVFDGIHYVALGHLHGPQQPRARAGGGMLRYSGSPLRYSFSEAAQQKSVTIVDLGPGGVTDIAVVELPQPRPMARLVGTIDELLHDAAHDAHRGSWVQATVTDSARPRQMRERVLARFPHLLDIRHLPGTTSIGAGEGVANPAGADPVAVVGDFVVHVTGSTITDAELTVFRAAHEVVLAAGREA